MGPGSSPKRPPTGRPLPDQAPAGRDAPENRRAAARLCDGKASSGSLPGAK
jgi:hypothetical protein